jgi:hypothetical protein
MTVPAVANTEYRVAKHGHISVRGITESANHNTPANAARTPTAVPARSTAMPTRAHRARESARSNS